MTEYKTLLIEKKEELAIIWMNIPEKHNALDPELIQELIMAFEEMNERGDIRIVMLRGKGKSFCAGANLNYMKGIAEFGYQENYEDSLVLAKCFNTIYTCKKPTIAVVHGAAIGGANGLLAACDFVFCDENTKFAFSEVKLGIAPATISPYVAKRVGEYGARDLMLTGRRFLGPEAERYNLVNKSVPTEELEAYVDKMVGYLMTSGPKAMEACKRLIYDISNRMSFEDSIDYTARMIAELRASEEGQEGMASFLEKRKPNWVKE
jgi:methylglutaconyl-CoA hydratase